MVLVLLLTPVGIWVAYRLLVIRQRINQLLRVEMVGNVQAQSMRFHADAPVGDSIYRTYQDSAMVTELMAMLVRPIGPLLAGVTGLFLGFLFDWRLPLLLLLLYIGMYWLALNSGNFDEAIKVQTEVIETLRNAGAPDEALREFLHHLDTYRSNLPLRDPPV